MTENDIVPRPDPTILTTQQLLREITSTKEIVETKVDGIKGVIFARMDANDIAVKLLQALNDRVPDFVREQISQLKEVHNEKFSSITTQFIELDKRTDQKFVAIDQQFAERDKRTEQLSLADKTAIAAALQAQKEAAGATNDSNSVALLKMETNFAKLIDQQTTLLQSVTRNTDDKINDLKSRLDRGEGLSRGTSEMRVDARENMRDVRVHQVETRKDSMSTISIAISIAALAAIIIIELVKH